MTADSGHTKWSVPAPRRHPDVDTSGVPFTVGDFVILVDLSYRPYEDPWAVGLRFREHGRSVRWNLSREDIDQALLGHRMVGEHDVMMWIVSSRLPGANPAAGRFFLRLRARDDDSMMFSAPLLDIWAFMHRVHLSVPAGSETELPVLDRTIARILIDG